MIELNKNFNIPTMDTTGKKTFMNPLGDDGHPDPCIVYCEKEKCLFSGDTIFAGTVKVAWRINQMLKMIPTAFYGHQSFTT